MIEMKERNYVGVSAYGLKMGAILPGTPLQEEIVEVLKRCDDDGMIDDGDILCITEAVVAKAQNNYVSLDRVAEEVREVCDISPDSTVLVVFPIASRNRFSFILKGIARAVNEGQVIVQMSFPDDEVGNRILDADLDPHETYDYDDLKGEDIDFDHPITGMNYLEYYRDIIEGESAAAEVKLSNDPTAFVSDDIDAVIVSSIHSRESDGEMIRSEAEKLTDRPTVVDLTQICCEGEVKCGWGLLGCNLSSGEKLKLAPRNPFQYVEELQKKVRKDIGKTIEVLIFGDGAYKDPESGIYELADPVAAFGYTEGLGERFREGNKYKYLVDKYLEKGCDREEIAEMIESGEIESEDEGTTPRKVKDLAASLADLVSGSADAGTPIVLIKDFI